MENLRGNTCGEFEETFKNILNKHAPIKTQMLRHNNNPYMTKDLRKEIIKRSKLVLTDLIQLNRSNTS